MTSSPGVDTHPFFFTCGNAGDGLPQRLPGTESRSPALNSQKRFRILLAGLYGRLEHRSPVPMSQQYARFIPGWSRRIEDVHQHPFVFVSVTEFAKGNWLN